jgi:leucyl aminopeptidase (aminopeptidase T)
MSLKGRKGLALHPLSGAAITTVPDYAEVAVSPVEGSTEGILVTEGGVRRWDLPLREPLRLFVKRGKVTEVSGPEDYVERFKNLIATDENASNCAAELGIGTTHTMPKKLMSSGVLVGSIHIAVGRNDDIGGETFSKIHNDLLLYKPTVWLDDLCLIKDGELKV